MSANPLVPNAIGESKYPALSNTEIGITAHAGGGQSSAYQLTAQASVVTVVATASDSVKLPKIINTPGQFGSVGTVLFVGNADASDAMQVFGTTPDTINDVATGTGVAVAAGVNVLFVATGYTQSTGVGKWRMTNAQAATVAAITSGTISGVTIDNSVIGGGTPAAGSFTALSASSALTVTGAITGSSNASIAGLTTLTGGAAFAVTASSTGTTIPATGIATLGSSAGGSASYALAAPTAAGIQKVLMSVGASTGQVVTSSQASITSSFGSSGTTLTFTGIGQAVTLYAQSTSQWMVAGRSLPPVFG